MTPLLTSEQAREIAKDYAPDIVADVEEHTALTGSEWTSIREHVQEELANVLEGLCRPVGERA